MSPVVQRRKTDRKTPKISSCNWWSQTYCQIENLKCGNKIEFCPFVRFSYLYLCQSNLADMNQRNVSHCFNLRDKINIMLCVQVEISFRKNYYSEESWLISMFCDLLYMFFPVDVINSILWKIREWKFKNRHLN